MTLIELIAFVVSMLLLIYLMGRRAKEERKRLKKDPEAYRKQIQEREKLLKEMFQALEIEESEEQIELEEEEPEPVPPPIQKPKRSVRKGYDFTTSFHDYDWESSIEDRQLTPRVSDQTIHIGEEPVISADLSFDDKRPYEIVKKETKSRLTKMVGRLPNARQMLIYHEVFGRPKALKPLNSHEFPLND